MAIYNVSTWAQLVEALSTDTKEAKTIKLTADINCNREIPYGVESSITIYESGSYPVVIDGSYVENEETKNHAIINLGTHVTTPVDIFKLKKTTGASSGQMDLTFKNVTFKNLLVMGAFFINRDNSSHTIYQNKLSFTNCEFSGKRNYSLMKQSTYGGSTGNEVNLTSCSFNIPYFPVTNENTYVPLFDKQYYGNDLFIYAHFCLFKETYNGWTISDNNGYQTSLRYIKLNGCKIVGELVGSNELKVTEQYAYASAIQNVVDADLKLLNGSNGANIYAPKGIWRNDVKNLDGSVSYTTTNANDPMAISETPANMKNPAQLALDGFDVVVPSSQGA